MKLDTIESVIKALKNRVAVQIRHPRGIGEPLRQPGPPSHRLDHDRVSGRLRSYTPLSSPPFAPGSRTSDIAP